MRMIIVACFLALLGACSAPNFIADAPPVPKTSKTPTHFKLPARFAIARTVYGNLETPGHREAEIWKDLAERAETLGSFTPLIYTDQRNSYRKLDKMIEAARKQRYNYLILLRMDPSSGSADVLLYDVGSGGVMATAQAVSPSGGRKGFWGGRINNPTRLERATLRIAKASVDVVEEMLRGVVKRQR